MWRGISLANKCLLLFGAAVVLIVLAALSVSWLRIQAIVEEGQRERSRQLVQGWLHAARQFAGPADAHAGSGRPGEPIAVGIEPGRVYELAPDGPRLADRPVGTEGSGAAGGSTRERVPVGDAGTIRVLHIKDGQLVSPTILAEADETVQPADGRDAEHEAELSGFLDRAWERLSEPEAAGRRASVREYDESGWRGDGRWYRYARLVELSGRESVDSATSGPGLVVMERTVTGAVSQMALNMSYLFSAGLISLGLAVLVFYLITNRLILSPVRSLRDTAERVREGDITTRAEIETGDEFQELGETFNQMLEALAASQQQLRSINTSLDLKVNELAERNVSLFEANKLKGEFLANVSHELRTPLNSILGFAELLEEQVEKDSKDLPDSPGVAKRRRYLQNITTAGRHLLGLINGLLDMAKLEAGRMELNIELTNVREECEALVALIRPLADRGGVELAVELSADVPLIETDRKKLQQIVFNLLSNAVKFTSEAVGAAGQSGTAGLARVTIRCERLIGRSSEGAGSSDRVRISVLDTGPGIAPEDQHRIFEKFQQLDTGHTRKHAGTGLGLAISRELTALLQGEMQLVSEVGRGSMFSVLLPLKLDQNLAKEMKLEMAFRGKLSSRDEQVA